LLAVGDETHDLSRDEAVQLRDALSDALTRTREFVHTESTRREDGTYVVERRGADSAGHRKVFERFEHCERRYERLPDSFTADDVGRSGLTGGRRHMLVWHYAEHPAFDCELTARQPLTVEKTTEPTGDDVDASTTDDADAPAGTNTPGERGRDDDAEVLPADD